jgi:hypothetical protein
MEGLMKRLVVALVALPLFSIGAFAQDAGKAGMERKWGRAYVSEELAALLKEKGAEKIADLTVADLNLDFRDPPFS